MPREYSRKLRVAAELQRVLNSLLSGEVKDPRLVGVTISALELSGDLSVARVGFSTLNPDDDPEPVLGALVSASGFLRSRAGAALSMRRVPELRFEHDDGARVGIEMGRLIDAAVADDLRTHRSDDDESE